MSNQRTTFGKRQREQNKKDKLKAKKERLAARRNDDSAPQSKGPPIATFAEAQAMISAGAPPLDPTPITPSVQQQQDTRTTGSTNTDS